MKSLINWLSKMLESMANAFMHPLKNDLPPSIGTHAYSSIPLKRKLRRRLNNYELIGINFSFLLSQIIYLKQFEKSLNFKNFDCWSR